MKVVSFTGNRSILKKEFDNGHIPLKRDITGSPLRRGESSIDHTIPKSRGGKSELYNYSLMNMVTNNKRGSRPLKHFIDLEAFTEYIKTMLDVKTMDFDGVDYIRGWLRNFLKEIKQNRR